jgi:hypothetical protein
MPAALSPPAPNAQPSTCGKSTGEKGPSLTAGLHGGRFSATELLDQRIVVARFQRRRAARVRQHSRRIWECETSPSEHSQGSRVSRLPNTERLQDDALTLLSRVAAAATRCGMCGATSRGDTCVSYRRARARPSNCTGEPGLAPPRKPGSSLFPMEGLLGLPEGSGAKRCPGSGPSPVSSVSAARPNPAWHPKPSSLWPPVPPTLHKTFPRTSP